ncbi:hypothetical protein MNEG_0158 [Monoraphidium neglectum]|uniref:BTB domain-containing protein n=1 Tax=Monoraphidium neglectum TaxID=145388 RepID=A0A0D2MZF5_9CHLO|nr:hypothetical protein MNEG_0158 [Monoraphidium neglectum]KIZ07800.1 hypothetical protein MNEG_0158 [Monoraphidium neglectum]|eukprot:XP_013906819.1 hypothetical protein MNEG_0158 [Monoraphidium neglectum]
MSRLASAWLNSEYADAEALITLHETGGELSDTCLLVARLPVHRLILAAASPYFAALFERWAQRHHDTCERPACVLHVTAPEDVPAAVALLRCCYTGTFEDLVQSGSSAPTLLLAPAGHNKGGTCGIDAASSGPAAAATCWQQLAVRTLVLADRLDVAGVAESCVSALSGRLFAHQMEWECAMAALWLLPEPLAHQQMVAPLRRMAQVRIARDAAGTAAP